MTTHRLLQGLIVLLTALILTPLMLTGCGNGFSVTTEYTKNYQGGSGEYCGLPWDYAGIPTTEASTPYAGEDATIKETLQTGAFTIEDRALGGATAKLFLVFSGGVSGVFKSAVDGEKEIAAYLLSNALKLGLVPLTVRRTVQGSAGGVQYFVENTQAGKAANISANNFRKMMIFDFILRNRDRDTSNFLFVPATSQVVAIDNAASFYLGCGILSDIKKSLEIEKTLAATLKALDKSALYTQLDDIPESYKSAIWYQISQLK